jgi:peptide/nickel transport system substrate-binding protein
MIAQKRVLPGLCLAAALVVLSACGAPAATPASGSPEPAVPAAPAPASALPAIPAGAENVLRIRTSGDLSNADPAFIPASVDTYVAELVGEGLVHYKTGAWEYDNVLADSIKTSADGLRIEFKLREGVMFHGEYGELTAEDVKFSYERFLDEKLNAAYKGDWEALDKVEVTGKYSGAIVLKRPFAPLWVSTLPVTSGVIVSKKAVEKLGDQYATNPVGTGPYIFENWVPKQKITFKRNEAYWGTKPAWERIELIPIIDESAAEIALESGAVDFALITGASLDRFKEKGFSTQVFQTVNYSGIFLNVEHPQTKDIRVRQAIRLAVDVPGIIAGVYDGKADRACALFAEGQIGHWAEAPCYTRDVEAARKLLAEAGVASGTVMTLTMGAGDQQKALGEIIQANLGEIGLNVTVDQVDDSQYFSGDARVLRDRSMVYFDWTTSNPDPYWQVVWFSCEQIDIYNWMYWCDKEFDRLNAEAVATSDPQKRTALYIESQKLWDANANVVWTIRPTSYIGYNPRIIPAQLPNGQPMLWRFGAK